MEGDLGGIIKVRSNANVWTHACQVQVNMAVVTLAGRREYMGAIICLKCRRRLRVESGRWTGDPVHRVSIFFGDDEARTLRVRHLVGYVKASASQRRVRLPREARTSPSG